MSENHQLHLPDLTISGFRGIDSLEISRLGQVTLIAGKNGVGKTSILDAVRVYAARGHYSSLTEVLEKREEVPIYSDAEDKVLPLVDWRTLFYGLDTRENARITIGPKNFEDQVMIEAITIDRDDLLLGSSTSALRKQLFQELRITYRGHVEIAPLIIGLGRPHDGSYTFISLPASLMEEDSHTIRCTSLGPHLLTNENLVALALHTADDDTVVKEILKLISDADIDYVEMADRPFTVGGQRAIYKVASHVGPQPLKGLGDGALRLYSIALALANSKDGFLLIDEAENGLHHSVHRGLWRTVLRVAKQHNIQVLATTHSWDCVRGFAEASVDSKETESLYIRLERDHEGLYTVEYPEEELWVAAEHGIETR